VKPDLNDIKHKSLMYQLTGGNMWGNFVPHSKPPT